MKKKKKKKNENEKSDLLTQKRWENARNWKMYKPMRAMVSKKKSKESWTAPKRTP
jgi:hypothetical protein